jgi:hypothetical protein
MALDEFGDAGRIDVIAGHVPSRSGKGHRDRQADIAKPDDPDFPLMPHVVGP